MGSSSPSPESHELMMHHTVRTVTIPAAAPMEARIEVVILWKENSSSATKNAKTLQIGHHHCPEIKK